MANATGNLISEIAAHFFAKQTDLLGFNDPRNVVGKTEEIRLLREEMRRDLADQIARRVSHSLGS